ncbi:MAG: SDR family oxidoreductase [Promethearchaeota archaeon]
MKKEKLIKKQPFKNKIAIITGGSQGLGKATAKYFVELGGSVCIIARRTEILKEAANEIEEVKQVDSQFIEIITCDTTIIDKLNPLLTEFLEKHGIPDYLFNCVGYAFADYIENLSLEDFKMNMEVNYYGQLVPILILLPYFMKEKKGYIANVASMLGYMGLMGFATYVPSKYAVVGLSETLRNELKPYNIKVSILYPPAMDTPGFERENKTKPEECRLMEERGGLETPEDIAEVFIHSILKTKFNILPGEAKLIWKLNRYFPKLIRIWSDKSYKKARKRLGKT